MFITTGLYLATCFGRKMAIFRPTYSNIVKIQSKLLSNGIPLFTLKLETL